MRDSERDAVRDVTLAAYEEYAAIMPGQFWTGYRRHLLATLDAQGPADRIVVEQQGVVVGSVLLFPPAANAYGAAAGGTEWPEVRLLAVLPSARGQGVGTALMAECVRRARQAGAAALGLHTMDMMRAAMRMYERMGFVHVPDLDFSPAHGVLLKGYRLDLPT
jgi:GNAT superfamily N-acetyltransferase